MRAVQNNRIALFVLLPFKDFVSKRFKSNKIKQTIALITCRSMRYER